MMDLIVRIYVEYYRLARHRAEYTFEPTAKEEVMLQHFIEMLDKKYGIESIGLDFLIGYFDFQFDYWSNIKTKFGRGKVVLSYVIGKKAFQRWLKLDKWKRTYISGRLSEKLKEKVDIKKFMVSNASKQRKRMFLDVSSFEEEEKNKYYNELEGMVWCIAETTLYNHKSDLCLLCNHRNECKATLRANYPNVYKIRGYE